MSKIWFKEPAKIFEEAFPLGNGRIGAMVYGGAENEKISLNEDTLWSGYPEDKSRPGAPEALADARKLIDGGKKTEAQELIWKKMLSSWTAAYQPAGNLIIKMSHEENIVNYERELNLDNAVASVKYKSGNINYKREMFCSFPLNALIINIASDSDGSIDCC